jgi:hypothetical protein
MRTPRMLWPLVWLAVAACGAIPLPIRGLHGGDQPPSLDRKLVVGKDAPVTLVAEDGTLCITSRDRFEQTRIGSEVWCVWSGVKDASRAARFKR